MDPVIWNEVTGNIVGGHQRYKVLTAEGATEIDCVVVHMNIVQISFLLGHAQLQTTMIYLDITTDQDAKAMATLESESDKKVSAKWRGTGNGITAMCGLEKLNTK